MPDYSKGKIYKIVCNTTGLVYIGSTCEPTLARRLAGHRGKYNAFLKEKEYQYENSSFCVLKNNNYTIVLIEECSCLSKDILLARERYFIDTIDCVNKFIPTRTSKEYKVDNKDTISVKKKEYYDDNKKNALEYQTQYNTENYDYIKTKNLQFYHDNKVKKLEYQKNYNMKNKDKIKAKKELKVKNL